MNEDEALRAFAKRLFGRDDPKPEPEPEPPPQAPAIASQASIPKEPSLEDKRAIAEPRGSFLWKLFHE